MALHVVTRAPMAEGPGNDHVLVAVHGAMDRATSFRRLWAKLRDWEVVAYDRRGYAGSIEVPLSDDFDREVADLVDVVSDYVAGPKSVVVLGHSFGGDVVLAGVVAGRFDAAVVYEPPAVWLENWPTHQQFLPGLLPADTAEAFMRHMVGDGTWERLPQATRRLRRDEGPALVNDLRVLRKGPPFDPADITVPVVVGYGSRSAPQVIRWAKELARQLPRATLVEAPGAEHGIHFGDPGALAAMVRTAASMADGAP